MRLATQNTRFLIFSSLLALLLTTTSGAHAFSCPPKGPVATGSRVTVVYDPADTTMKACLNGSWVTMAGGGGGGNLDGLSDVIITSPANNQVLLYNGSNWVNSAVTVSESDPEVGALTANQWCAANSGGTAIVCNQAPPSGGGGSSSGTAGYLQISGGSGAFASSSTTAGNQLFWDTTNHRLGIGTTTPASSLKLDVNGGDIGIRDTAPALYLDAPTIDWQIDLNSIVFNAINFRNVTNSLNVMTMLPSGSIGIGTTAPNASALLDVSSTTQGVLLPRLTTTQVGAVATPTDGLIVYDVDTDTIKLRANGAWASLGAGGGGSPGGADTQIQYNNSGAFAGSSGLVWDNSTATLGVNAASEKIRISYNSPTFGMDIKAATVGGWARQYGFQNAANTVLGAFGGFGSADALSYLWVGPNYTSPWMTFLTNGNVGIGTTAPTAPLTVGAAMTTTNLTPIAAFNTTGLKPVVIGDGATGNGIMIGYSGNTIQARTSATMGTNGNLILNDVGGNVGIGTASPGAKLHVSGGSIAVDGPSSPFIFNETDQAANTPGKYWRMPLDGNVLRFDVDTQGDGDFVPYVTPLAMNVGGNVGINNITPAYLLTITGKSSGLPMYIKANDATNYAAQFSSQNNNSHAYFAYNTIGVYGATSTAASNAIYGYTTGTGSIALLGVATQTNSHGFLGQNTSSGYYCYIGYANTYALLCSGPDNTTSDLRLKKDIVSLDKQSGLDAIMGLRPVSYHWKDERKNQTGKRQMGFIAQEVEKVLPDLVNGFEPTTDDEKEAVKSGESKLLSVQYEGMIAPLVQAVQELKAENDNLRARLEALEKNQKAE